MVLWLGANGEDVAGVCPAFWKITFKWTDLAGVLCGYPAPPHHGGTYRLIGTWGPREIPGRRIMSALHRGIRLDARQAVTGDGSRLTHRK